MYIYLKIDNGHIYVCLENISYDASCFNYVYLMGCNITCMAANLFSVVFYIRVDVVVYFSVNLMYRVR